MSERFDELRAQLNRRAEVPEPTPISVDSIVAAFPGATVVGEPRGPRVGIMAATYISVNEKSLTLPEVRRVVQKLDPISLVVFADGFGMVAADLIDDVPYILVGPHRVPCHPAANWNGPIDLRRTDAEMVMARAVDITLMSNLESAESHAAARLHVVQTCDVLILVGGRKALFQWQHPDTVLIDKSRGETTRRKIANADEAS